MPLSINKGTFVNDKKEDRFNKVYDSDGEPGPFYDIEDLEDTQYFDEYALFDFSSLMLEFFSLIMKVMNMLQKEGKSQIMINLIQCMLTFHNIMYKILMLISSKKKLGEEKPLYGTKTLSMKYF